MANIAPCTAVLLKMRQRACAAMLTLKLPAAILGPSHCEFAALSCSLIAVCCRYATGIITRVLPMGLALLIWMHSLHIRECNQVLGGCCRCAEDLCPQPSGWKVVHLQHMEATVQALKWFCTHQKLLCGKAPRLGRRGHAL